MEQIGGFGWRYARSTLVVLEKSGTGAASRAQASQACSRAAPGPRPGGTMTALRGARCVGPRKCGFKKRGLELRRSVAPAERPPVERRKAWCPDRKGRRRVPLHAALYQGAFRRSTPLTRGNQDCGAPAPAKQQGSGAMRAIRRFTSRGNTLRYAACALYGKRRHPAASLISGEDSMTNGSTLSLPQLNDRIAILRDNIRQLTEQAAAFSGAEDEARNADRIAQQTEELERLVKERDAHLKKK